MGRPSDSRLKAIDQRHGGCDSVREAYECSEPRCGTGRMSTSTHDETTAANGPRVGRHRRAERQETHAGGAEFVRSLERGLAVIRAFDAEHPELTLSEVARATGLTRAAARRFLHTLVELGYVRGNGRLFALRPRILELGFAYLSGLGLSEVVTPHLEALVAMVRESSSVSVL